MSDVSGEPLRDVDVTLDSVGEPWTPQELRSDDEPAFHCKTDEEGRFAFDTPLPTSSWVNLLLCGSPFHTRADRDFGPAGGCGLEPLRPGDNDLGTFVLSPAGSFEGRVTDPHGTPLAGAYVKLDGTYPGGMDVGALSAADGAYRVDHVPGGRYPVYVRMDGFLTQRRADVEVVDGRVRGGLDFVLDRAPTVAGRVTDARGNPLAGVRISGWPLSSGQGAMARSAADGTFVIALPQDEPYTLEAELDGYEPMKRETHGGLKPSQPGDVGVEIVLAESALATYVVVDARDGAPIERFGMRILEARTTDGWIDWSSDTEVPRVGEHPGGTVQLPGDPRFHDYTVVAPGYGPRRGRVAFDDDCARRQTIRLDRAGRLTGRFVLQGKPLDSPSVQIRADRIALRAGVTEGEDDVFSEDWGTDIDAYAGRPTWHRGAADGGFVIEDLATGTYRLLLTANGAAPRTVRGVRVQADGTTHVGDVEAELPARIHGTIVLAAGVSPGGLKVALGEGPFDGLDAARTTDASGEFIFEGLASGLQHVRVEGKPGILVAGEPIEVLLHPGQTAELRLDLSERAPCELEVSVSFQGLPAAGARVMAAPAGARESFEEVGGTDSGGSVAATWDGRRPVILEVRGQAGLTVGRRTEPLELAPGGRVHVDLAMDAGRLTVRMPRAVLEAEEAMPMYFLLVEGLDQPGRFQTAGLPRAEWHIQGNDLQADLGWIEPGAYAVKWMSGAARLDGRAEVNAGHDAVCTLSETAESR